MRSMTVTGAAEVDGDAVRVPVVGGVVVVLATGVDADRLVASCRAGARLDCRIADHGDGWWLASAARCRG